MSKGVIGVRAWLVAVLGMAAAVALPGCSGPIEQHASSVRLIDLFAEATVAGAQPIAAPQAPGPAWAFSEAPAGTTGGWHGRDVRRLGVRDGLLSGETTSTNPILHAERESAIDEDDLLHAVEIAARISSGGRLSVRFDDDEEPDFDRIRNDPFPWTLSASVIPGDELQRYQLRPGRSIAMSEVRHVLIRPVDAKGVSFAIESVKFVSRREYLASVDSGLGWHGMGNIFRESIVSRAPETISFSLTLPARPRLDLALATVEEGPATFRITAQPEVGDPVVIERSVTLPHRWNPVYVDLASLAGQRVELSLALSANHDGFLGFWGTAAIRSRVAQRAESPPERPQGVIVLLADTLRSDHLSAWGYRRPTAPFLTSLAASGVRAEDCVSQATWTKVSVPSIFTSLYPTTHSVAEFTDQLPGSADTLAEQFRSAGYATLALTSIPFTGKFTNLHQGYEELHEARSLQDSSDSKTAREYMDRLLPWLDEHRDVPFFVFLHVADPHSPYRAYQPFDTEWGEQGDVGKLDQHRETVRPHIKNPVMQRFVMPTRSELAAAGVNSDEYVGYELDAYDGSILGMDFEVRRLFERLRELGLADKTLLAFVSDHGTEFLDHDQHFHGHSVYGELNRVPLFLWGPQFLPSGVVLEPTVQTIDLMPTILDLAQLQIPELAQGRSLLSLIRAAERGEAQVWDRPAVTEKAVLRDGELPGRSFGSMSIIADGWKLVRHQPVPQGLSEFELYDHRSDPLNLRDVAADQPQRVQQLAALLEEWHAQALAVKLDDSDLHQNLDDEELERLRSLGYIR